MDNQMVAPSKLHRVLEGAKDAGEARMDILVSTLASRNLAVIRRIPELMSPLSDEEKTAIVEWATGLTEEQDVSNRDFAFHLLVNCEVSSEQILALLEQNQTFSRSALEHIQQVLESDGSVGKLDSYLREVAEALLGEERIPSRDRGRHMLMTLARTETDWQILARQFSERYITDLRQRVLERFLYECPEGTVLTLFVDNVVKMCTTCVRDAAKEDVHKEASHMHWTLMCLYRLERKAALTEAARLFVNKFGNALPHSLRYKIDDITRRAVKALHPSACNGSANTMRTLTKPRSVEEALHDGWEIRKESGKQVILVKDKTSVTLYRR